MTSDPQTLRVGVYTARRVVIDNRQVLVENGLGVVVNGLHQRFPNLTLAASEVPEQRDLHNMSLTIGPDRVMRLPWLRSLAGGSRQTGPCLRQMRELERRCDVVLVQLAFPAPLALLCPRTPRVYHLVGDVQEMARVSPQYQGVRRLPAQALGEAYYRIQRHLIASKQARVVTNGQDLLDSYPGARGRALVSSTVHADEIDTRPRIRPPGRPFRVLFVGHLRPEKGIDTLLTAFDSVYREIPGSELHIVGPPLGGEATTGQLARFPPGRVVMRGPIWDTDELFQCYAESDVLVLPSRSEGTPRVLVEARAFRCPVIASAVGGVPTSVTHGVDGLLVPPDDPTAVATAVKAIATDTELRERLVAGGLRRARASSAEAFADAVADELLLAASRTTVVDAAGH